MKNVKIVLVGLALTLLLLAPGAFASMTWNEATSSAAWTARFGVNSVVYNSRMWICGGDIAGGGSNDVWSSLDGVTWTEATSAAAWGKRAMAATLVYDGYMWEMGGTDPAGSSFIRNDVWSSTDGATWNQATAAAAWHGRGLIMNCTLVYGSRMWLLGGYGAGEYNDVWSSTDGATWSQATAAAPWSGRDSHVCLTYNSKMWVLGGYGSGNYDVWSSSDGASWTKTSPTAGWSKRESFSGVVWDNGSGPAMWIYGGTASGDGANYNDVWSSYNGTVWTQENTSANWTTRKVETGVVFNNELWVMGGYGGSITNDCWYAPGGVGVEEHTSARPVVSAIHVYPNPFSSFASVPGHESERFVVYDVSGRQVGIYSGARIGEGLSPGVYFLRAEQGNLKPLRIVKVR